MKRLIAHSANLFPPLPAEEGGADVQWVFELDYKILNKTTVLLQYQEIKILDYRPVFTPEILVIAIYKVSILSCPSK